MTASRPRSGGLPVPGSLEHLWGGGRSSVPVGGAQARQPVRHPDRKRMDQEGTLMGCLSVRYMLVPLLLGAGLACGVKAPPVPRETVVPSPVLELGVRPDGDGVVLEFTLPATRLDGGRLAGIAGYRVQRTGPDGDRWEREVRFSFSQQSAMVGKKVTVYAPLPPRPGVHRYTVVPLDAYGSHPRGNAWAEFSLNGPDRRAGSPPDGNTP